MIVCDECRDVESKAFDCFIVVEKMDEPPRKANRVLKPKPREIVKIPVALCEACLTLVCKSLGRMKATGTIIERQRADQTNEGAAQP